MEMYNLALEICTNSSILKTLSTIRVLIFILKILIPIIIIYKGIKDIGKEILGSDPSKVTGSAAKLIKLLFVGLLIFIIPTLIVNALKLFVDYEDVKNKFIDCQSCLDNKYDCDVAIQIAEYFEEQNAYSFDEEQEIEGRFDVGTLQSVGGKTSDDQTEDAGIGRDPQVVGGSKYFDREDVTKISGLTAEELKQKLNNCKKYGGKAKRYVPYAEELIAVEKKWGLNVFYMLGVYSLESGWAGSDLAQKCNNLGGIKYGKTQTYNGKHTTKCWQQKTGAWFAGFDSIGGFAEYHAKLIITKYVTPGAPYYHGKTPEAISQVYGHKNSVGTVIEIATNLSNA